MYSDVCPVCGMKSVTSNYKTEYNKLLFHFCSQQCFDNFNARPLLYLKSSVEPRLKRRTLRLPVDLDEKIVAHICSEVGNLMGVLSVEVVQKDLIVKYDLVQVSAAQIEETLVEIGMGLGSRWLDRLRRAWINYLEENELDALASTNSACCNRAPKR